jgi:hypothetical protein
MSNFVWSILKLWRGSAGKRLIYKIMQCVFSVYKYKKKAYCTWRGEYQALF